MVGDAGTKYSANKATTCTTDTTAQPDDRS